MSYCVLADLVDVYGERELIQLTDRTNKPVSQIDEGVVERAIDDAAAEINLHLHARYQLPLATVPSVLKRICCILAWANLHTRLDKDHPALQAAEGCRRTLNGLATGRLSLALDAGGEPAAIANTVQVSSTRNDWGSRW